jgi:hypothetical protein
MTTNPVRTLKIQSSVDYAFLLKKVREVLIEGQKRIEAERVRVYWETGYLIHRHILKYERAPRAAKRPFNAWPRTWG